MNSVLLGEDEEAGFSFKNCQRNENLIKEGFTPSQMRKTGTTICGIVIDGGVILGADTRATNSGMVFDKQCEKIHYIQDNISCCGAGMAADTKMTSRFVSSNMELIRLNSNREFIPVKAAAQFTKQYLYRYHGHMKSFLVLGGVDSEGPHIYSIHAYGSTDRLPYTSLGSGSWAAMSILETRWKPNMNLEEGKQLVRDAIAAGVLNDLGSGSSVDICIIQKNYHKTIRGYDHIAVKGDKRGDYTPKRGTTGVLSCRKFDIEIVDEKVLEEMDIEDD